MDLNKTQLLNQIRRWKHEIEGFSCVYNCSYSKQAFSTMFDRLETLNSYVSRVDAIFGDLTFIKIKLKSVQSQRDTEFEEAKEAILRQNLSSWASSGMSAPERLQRASSMCLDQRIALAQIMDMINILEIFSEYVKERKNTLMRAKYDCNVSVGILDMAIKLGEIK